MIQTNIPIWGKELPGNSTNNKLAYLDIGPKRPDFWLMLNAAFSMAGTEAKDLNKAKRKLDTYQYYHEIHSGFRPKTFEDVPCMDYYPCDGADTAVLIIPGGGFTYQSNSGIALEKQYEGGALAVKLNNAGIAAFVLSRYRLDPYRMPIPLLDTQRAIRYIRFHAKDFGIDPNKIGITGFSAGGYMAAATVHILRNRSVNEIIADAGRTDICYAPDEVDQTDAVCAFAGLPYAMLSFSGTVPAMCAAFPLDEVQDADRRNALIQKYDTIRCIRPGDPPAFIALGTKDAAVDNTDDKTRYMKAMDDAGVPYEYLSIPGAPHGFGAKDGKYSYWVDKFIAWIKETL